MSRDYDSSESRRSPYEPKDGYGQAEYHDVLQRIHSKDQTIPLVLTNADWETEGTPLRSQLKAARHLFGQYPEWAASFIIKPWEKTKSGAPRQYIKPDDLSVADYRNLAGFSIIGVTEKELGKNLKDKLKAVIALRHRLDEAGIEAPIHLWGGLDPVMTPLFFFAGADIFDGISWLRYAFHHGVALNRECGAVLDPGGSGINTGADKADFMASHHNLEVIENLADALRSWVKQGGDSCGMFDPNVRDYLKVAYEKMTTWGPPSKGGK